MLLPIVLGSTMEAEGVRFELTRPFGLPVFKTGAINRSATPPGPARVRGRKFITPLQGHSKRNHAAVGYWNHGVLK